MGKIYDIEELIFEVNKDVSNASFEKNNYFKIRVIRRVKIKPINFFRKKEKVNVYYDIEFIKPRFVSSNDSFPLTNAQRIDINKENKKIEEYNDYVRKIFKEEMWNAEKYCLKCKNEKKDKGQIKIKSLSSY